MLLLKATLARTSCPGTVATSRCQAGQLLNSSRSADNPKVHGVDHIHVHVPDRTYAEKWYKDVLGFRRVKELEEWATDDGPLTIVDSGGNVHQALLEREAQDNHATIALKTDGDGLLSWRAHMSDALDLDLELVEHELSWSIYFSDPFGNPFEITTYDWTSKQLSTT